MTYNWQQPDWPDFKYDLSYVEDLLYTYAEETGQISGLLRAASDQVVAESLIDTMAAEAIKTSEIEGEYLSRQDVVSSLRNNLGMNSETQPVKDQRARGLAKLMIDARNSYADALTEQKLFEWHELLFDKNTMIDSGSWRKGQAPMQVISGTIGKEKIHFEAPPSAQVETEMSRFIAWFNDTAPNGRKEIKKGPVRSAIAHLYFESIHPFEDGNGRIGRILAEKALSQALDRPVLLSLSRKIEANKKDYYLALETAQRSNKITGWINYFVQTIVDAQLETRELLDFTLLKTRFFDRLKHQLNDRQLKAINKMLDSGPKQFEGGMTAKKYMGITKTTKATATRDLQNLVEMGALMVQGGGRSTAYSLDL